MPSQKRGKSLQAGDAAGAAKQKQKHRAGRTRDKTSPAVQRLGGFAHVAMPVPMGMEASQSLTKPSPRGGNPGPRGRATRVAEDDFAPGGTPDHGRSNSNAGPAFFVSSELSGERAVKALATFRDRATALRGVLASRWQKGAGIQPMLGVAGARLSQAVRTFDKLKEVAQWGDAERTEFQLAVNSVVFADAALRQPAGKNKSTSRSSSEESAASLAKRYGALV